MKQWAEIRLTGQAQDPTPRNVGPDLWNTVTDVVFRDGAAQPTRARKVGFHGKYESSPPNIYYLRDIAVSYRGRNSAGPMAKTFWTYGGLAAYGSYFPYLFYRDWDGTAISNITPAVWSGLASLDNITGGEINGCRVWNHHGAVAAGGGTGFYPVYYDFEAASLAAAATVLPGWNTSAGTAWRTWAIRPYRGFLVAMGKVVGDGGTVASYPHTVFWSDASATGIPSTWTASSTNMAGETEIDSHGGNLIDGIKLGDDFIIFKERACYRMSYVGGTGVFAFRLMNADRGMGVQNGGANVGGRLIVAGGDDVYALAPDGSAESLMTARMRRTYAALAEDRTTNQGDFQVSYSSPTREVFVTTNTYGFILDLDSGQWGHIDLTSDGDVPNGVNNVRSIPYHASIGGISHVSDASYVWFFGNGTSDDSAICWDDPDATTADYPLTGGSDLTKYALDLGDPVNYKLAHRIRLIVEAATGETFTVSVTGKDSPAGTTVSSASATWTAGTTRDIGLSVQGRFFDVTVTNAPQNLTPWKLSGFDIEFSPAGAW